MDDKRISLFSLDRNGKPVDNWIWAELLGADDAPDPYKIDLSKYSYSSTQVSKYSYSSTQVNLPENVARRVRALAAQIPECDLAADGREDNPHITVKYGLHTDDAEEVRGALHDQAIARATLGRTTYFKNVEGGTADAVVIEVYSACLRRLNHVLSNRLMHTTTYADYKPHVTVAYVKPGLGTKYANDMTLEGVELTFDTVVFSNQGGRIVSIELNDDDRKNLEQQTSQLGQLVDDEVLEQLSRLMKYDPSQPRDESGRWTDGGGSGGSSESGRRSETDSETSSEAGRHTNRGISRVREVPAAVHSAEHEIRDRQFEHAHIFDSSGKQIGKFGGYSESSVEVPDGLDLKDAVFTHNHPRGTGFSPDDIALTVSKNLAEMRAVTKEGTFRFARKTDDWPNEVSKEYRRQNDVVYQRVIKDIASGKETLDHANKVHWTRVAEAVAAMFPDVVGYTFEKRKS